MDGESTGQHRDVTRVFQVDRHSEAVLATVFERLSDLGKELDPKYYSPVENQSGSNQQFQEAKV